MKYFYVLLLLLCGNLSFTQSLFNASSVHKIEIIFFDEDWDHQLDLLASEGVGTGSGTGRILANVIINGTMLDSCGVRYKGNSSMDTSSNKNPFNIDINYTISGQEYQGKDKIKLANCFTDPSMIREALTYEIANRYMDCPRASFVELSINGEYRGIYTNTESIDNEFLETHYGSSENPFFKCDPVSFDIYGDNSNLAFHPDSMAYDTLYDMKSEYGLKELQDFTYELEFEPTTIDNYMDVDRALWFLALSNALVHNDGYTAFAHNFYVYKMDNGKWSIVLWDVNMSFGGLLWNGTNLLPLGMAALQEQDPFLHQDAFDFRPLIAGLLSNPRYKRMYVAHYKTIMEENLSNDYYLERAEEMHDLIDSFVESEPYNPYSFADFNTNLYNNVGFWFDLRPGLENLMETRLDYLNALPEFEAVQPTISAILATPANPDAYSTVNFTTTITDANFAQFGYRYHPFDSFILEPMFDDGAHGDGVAGDGIYGINVSILATEMEYYFYAENTEAGKFSPVRAAHEFYTISPEKELVINEILADNETIAANSNGAYTDWIELYNNTAEPINLDGYHLSDNASDLSKWTFPATIIGAGEYLIIWADEDTLITEELHANFKLSASGEELILSDNSEVILDQINFPTQFEDITFGRYENGIGDFDYLYPTFNSENSAPVGLTEEAVATNPITVFPNPARHQVTIQYSTQKSTTLRLFDLQGKIVYETILTHDKSILIDVSALTPGLYVLTDSDGEYTKLLIK